MTVNVKELPQLLTEKEISAKMMIPLSTLRRWRCDGTGPPYRKFQRLVRYELDEVLKWIEARRVRPVRG